DCGAESGASDATWQDGDHELRVLDFVAGDRDARILYVAAPVSEFLRREGFADDQETGGVDSGLQHRRVGIHHGRIRGGSYGEERGAGFGDDRDGDAQRAGLAGGFVLRGRALGEHGDGGGGDSGFGGDARQRSVSRSAALAWPEAAAGGSSLCADRDVGGLCVRGGAVFDDSLHHANGLRVRFAILSAGNDSAVCAGPGDGCVSGNCVGYWRGGDGVLYGGAGYAAGGSTSGA